MFSSNKGITLVALAITIIMLAILTSVTINVGTGTYREMQLQGYVAKMNMIQSRVNVISQKIENGDTSYNDVGEDISSLSQTQKNKINTILNGTSSDGFKYYNQSSLKELGLDKIDEDVIINLNTRIIYSIIGIKYEGTMYYNQYNLPNGVQVVEYSGIQTVAPQFTLEKDNYGLNVNVNITNIIYDEQINGSEIYYGEVVDSTTTPVTVSYWQRVNGTSFNVTKTATYAVKLIDKNNGETIKTIDVVTCNSPELTSGMVPVIYENGKWKKVQENEIGKWYDYAEKKWANIMLSDNLVVNADGTIDDSNMGSMFVWIPRYAYQITSNYHNGGENIAGNINVKFLKNTTYLTTDEVTTKMINASGEGNWNVHPAFTDGSVENYQNGGWDRELTGIWVAKFEASSSNSSLDYGGGNVTNLDVKVLPNVTSWRNIEFSNLFTNCLNMNKSNNIYGIPENAITHLMKNSEWGAVAYLTQSKYGRDGQEVTINNSSTYITGNAGSTISASSADGVTNAYNTEKGVLASTTGTIYGIYDMNGGSDEYVSAGLTEKIDSSIKTLEQFEEKYVDRYLGNSTDIDENYNKNSSKFGDAIYETSRSSGAPGENGGNNSEAWNGDGGCFAAYAALLKRGNAYDRDVNAGIYSFHFEDKAKDYISFRPSIIIE